MNGDVFYLTSDVQLAPADSSEDALPSRFSGVAYSGGIASQYGSLVIDLGSTRTEAQMPLLFHHAHESLIGTVTKVDNSGSALSVEGDLFTEVDDLAKSVAAKAKRGARYQMSVGVFDANWEDVPRGKTVEVNGRSFAGPVSILRDGFIRETSIVALGADAATRADFFSRHTGGNPVSEDLKARVAELERQNADLQAALDAKTTKLTELQQAVDAERAERRQSDVKALFQSIGREFSEDAAKPYLGMDQAAFDAVAADLKASVKPGTQQPSGADPSLFTETATGEPAARPGALLAQAKQRHGIQ